MKHAVVRLPNDLVPAFFEFTLPHAIRIIGTWAEVDLLSTRTHVFFVWDGEEVEKTIMTSQYAKFIKK